MARRIALLHRTHYAYERAVQLGPHTIRLRPAPHCRTTIESYALAIEPGGHHLLWHQDPCSNHLARAMFPRPSRSLCVEVRLVARLSAINPFDFFLEPECEHVPVAYGAELTEELAPYRASCRLGPLAQSLVARLPGAGTRAVDYLVAMNRLVADAVRYLVRMDPGVQEPERTMELGSGSCRDSAWLLVAIARAVGLAARFTSGYLVQTAPDPGLDGRVDGPSRDVLDLHAWAEIYLPGAGWIGLDATSGLLCGEGHLPLASTPSPSSAAPISGGFAALDGSKEVPCTMTVDMEAVRLDEAARPSRPYDEATWSAILAAGDGVESALADVELTMGGEPTFVARDARDAPEWTTEALGGAKRVCAEQLVKRLRAAFAPGALLHYGQGKWYPGEPLPRWSLGCWWRADGVPVWRDDALIADRARPAQLGAPEAERFAQALAVELGIDADWIQPAHEDAWYYLWREHRLPVGEDPIAARLDDPLERARLARVFTRGLGAVAGFALPLAQGEEGRWLSGPWTLRAGRLLLNPGDSPMGFRLPLDALPWATPADREAAARERDPFAPRAPLPARLRPATDSAAGAAASELVRTSLCVEPRDGVLNIFLPPIAHLEAYLSLVEAVERCAERIGQPVAIEGYHPPRDHRLLHLAVTPDPGVIEVNIHPQGDWRALAATNERLYAEAAACGLVAERFLVDGRACGTGGGSHITLGGERPERSPFLRRPDLLRSMIAYWHNHPALSYLFSGLFIGPTSQAPRADEARTETVYELDAALARLEPGAAAPPWLLDRALRHLLVDVTGNTHRAEFCIDKLFSPDSASGRLGLVELRGFEMPSHPRLAASQQLLVRALVARFWREPYTQPLARWGTDLHDRHMLPAVLWRDLGSVIDELRERSLPLELDWFAPHRDARCPVLGAIEHGGVALELSQALEPWHVLGEEPGAGGTVRYVDSSLERIQVRLTGLADDRHAVACNGHRLPLHRMGDERICGVRFRAWQPPTALHPTNPVHAPLDFEIVDTWNALAVAACRYQVAHPGGRAYARPPVNAVEAEARRSERFLDLGGRPATRTMAAVELDPEYPFTLDLRHARAAPAERRAAAKAP